MESKVQSKHHIYITFLLTFIYKCDILIVKKETNERKF